jgi:hypothetical protein
VAARKFSSALSATAQAWDLSGAISWKRTQSPVSLQVQTFSSPPKPAETATWPAPPREVQTWWMPRRWALDMDWISGKEEDVVVAWMCRVEEPLAERRQDLVAAREKMSAMWAGTC